MQGEPEATTEGGTQGVRDYIENLLDQLAELAGRSGELKIATTLRLAALEVSRADPIP